MAIIQSTTPKRYDLSYALGGVINSAYNKYQAEQSKAEALAEKLAAENRQFDRQKALNGITPIPEDILAGMTPEQINQKYTTGEWMNIGGKPHTNPKHQTTKAATKELEWVDAKGGYHKNLIPADPTTYNTVVARIEASGGKVYNKNKPNKTFDETMAEKGWTGYTKEQLKGMSEKQLKKLYDNDYEVHGDKLYVKHEKPGKGSTTTNVSVNMPSMEKSTKGKVETNIINAENSAAQASSMLATFNPAFLEKIAAIKSWTRAKLNSLGFDSMDDFTRQRIAWIQQNEQFFNAYRKAITGAQASMQEINLLRTTIPTTDLSPDEYEAAAISFIIIQARLAKRNKFLLQSGMIEPLSPNASPSEKNKWHNKYDKVLNKYSITNPNMAQITLNDNEIKAYGLDAEDPLVRSAQSSKYTTGDGKTYYQKRSEMRKGIKSTTTQSVQTKDYKSKWR